MVKRLDRAGVDLVVELSESNAPRRCSMCDQDGRFYVYSDAVLSKYVCENHLDAVIQEAQA